MAILQILMISVNNALANVKLAHYSQLSAHHANKEELSQITNAIACYVLMRMHQISASLVISPAKLVLLLQLIAYHVK